MKRISNWGLVVLLGLTTLVLSLYLSLLFPQEVAIPPASYGNPVFSFEMASSQQDLYSIFGMIDDPLRASRVASMDAGNRWDYAFMILYGLYLGLFFRVASKVGELAHWKIFAGFGVLAALADSVENYILLGLTSNLEHAPNLMWLPYPVYIKFMCLFVCGLGGAFVVSRGGALARILGGFMYVGAIGAAYVFLNTALKAYFPLVGLGIGVCWVGQFLYATRWLLRDVMGAEKRPG